MPSVLSAVVSPMRISTVSDSDFVLITISSPERSHVSSEGSAVITRVSSIVRGIVFVSTLSTHENRIGGGIVDKDTQIASCQSRKTYTYRTC